MKKLLAATMALALSASIAAAGGWPKPKPQPQPTANASASASARASASAHQRQNQHQGQMQGQGQSQGIYNNQEYKPAASGVAVGAGNCDVGFGVGVVEATTGMCWQTVTGNSVRVATALAAIGDKESARAILLNTPVAKRAIKSRAVPVSVSGKSAVKGEPVVAAAPYVKCGHNSAGNVVFKRRAGSSSEVARAACLTHLGY